MRTARTERGNGKAPFPHLSLIAHSGSRNGREGSKG